MEGQVWWDMPVIPAPLESETEDQDLRPAQANVWDTVWECKVRAEGVWFKWVEHLPGYLKAWGSMPSTAKKKKNAVWFRKDRIELLTVAHACNPSY
jgi:hypothetical protein